LSELNHRVSGQTWSQKFFQLSNFFQRQIFFFLLEIMKNLKIEFLNEKAGKEWTMLHNNSKEKNSGREFFLAPIHRSKDQTLRDPFKNAESFFL